MLKNGFGLKNILCNLHTDGGGKLEIPLQFFEGTEKKGAAPRSENLVPVISGEALKSSDPTS